MSNFEDIIRQLVAHSVAVPWGPTVYRCNQARLVYRAIDVSTGRPDRPAFGRGETIILHEFHEEPHLTYRAGDGPREPGPARPHLDDLINHGSRVVDVFGDLCRILSQNSSRSRSSASRTSAFVLEGQDCQVMIPPLVAEWANEILIVVDPGESRSRVFPVVGDDESFDDGHAHTHSPDAPRLSGEVRLHNLVNKFPVDTRPLSHTVIATPRAFHTVMRDRPASPRAGSSGTPPDSAAARSGRRSVFMALRRVDVMRSSSITCCSFSGMRARAARPRSRSRCGYPVPCGRSVAACRRDVLAQSTA